ncbi:hypothetical protein CDL12_11470 [Handroanthus impetiginosus]|uniref:VQ domain-containing protein n=1 Tax=Handroanthus impetiginosus TaxID=429701 RepID=A0A2G9HED6_9LAMI|nr:hypothetical protein CDL12_11470 [Handroanthus impetiginosus]
MAGCRNSDPVKVVIINTQYVETDPLSFKSVVQSLTGKESTAAARKPPRFQSSAGVSRKTELVLSRGLSFKNFERTLTELSPVDELYRLYAE